MDVDVVVVGAGLSGLAAARRVRAAGLSVRVLEASDRVGGRVRTEPFAGTYVDLGGQWIGPGQDRVAALIAELGLKTFPTHHAGRKVLDLDGKVGSYAGAIPSLPPLALAELELTIRKAESMIAGVPTVDPVATDAITVGEWARRRIWSRRVRALLAAAVKVVFGADPDEVSLLQFLSYAHAGGGLLRLIEIEGGAQESRVVGGTQAIAEGLARGTDVALGSPVRAIHQGPRGVTIATDAGPVTASRAIVAIPPALAARIAWDPALPADRDLLTQRLPMAGTIKCIALYDRPFWRDDGWSGEVVADGDPLTVVFDNTTAAASGIPSLLGFIVGRDARVWGARAPEARRDAVLAKLARWFGPRAARPVAYVDKDWGQEPFVRGCPIGVAGPNVLSVHGHALRAPCGRVHWAGTESATRHTGFMDGALTAGERAADEVIAELGRER
jgi:monoamine oxidase